MATHSLAQLRAQHALKAINELLQLKEPESYGNYLGYVKALPSNIRSLGLGQALAFALGKARGDLKTPYGLLYAHVTDWVCAQRIYSGATSQTFMNALTDGTQDQYLHAQIEAMAYLEWLKKFAVAQLKAQEGEDE
jgi:CRISPR-associated protein Cmr5